MLSIPFLVRSAYNLLAYIFMLQTKVLNHSIQNDTWTAPIIYFVFILVADLLPITSQLVSMIVVIDDLQHSSVKNNQVEILSETSTDNLSYLCGDEDDMKIQFKTTGNTSGYFGNEIPTRFTDVTPNSRFMDKSSSSR